MGLDFVATTGAPKAIGPYSQAVGTDDLLFCSGQIALDPATGELKGATAAEQTRQALKNLSAVLVAGGSGLEHVLRTTVFLKDMADFAAMNEVYAQAFGPHRPSRSTVAVAALPRGALVEIDVIARRQA
ncbi:MAG TPA: RidA family protein [Planctomycetota bacterium]|nr:RidA family protein [Planctomycetota bacterium]